MCLVSQVPSYLSSLFEQAKKAVKNIIDTIDTIEDQICRHAWLGSPLSWSLSLLRSCLCAFRMQSLAAKGMCWQWSSAF